MPERLIAFLQEQTTRFRERYLPGGAFEQLRAQLFFQPFDQAAQRRLSDEQHVRRTFEMQVFRDRYEGFHLLKIETDINAYIGINNAK